MSSYRICLHLFHSAHALKIVTRGKISFFYDWIIYSHLHCPFIGQWIQSPHIVAATNAAMTMRMHRSFQVSVFIFTGWIPRIGIAGSHCSSIYNFFGRFQCYFSSWLHQFIFLPIVQTITFIPHPCLHVILFVLNNIHSNRWLADFFSIISVNEMVAIMVLVCISLMVSNDVHLFMHLSAICISLFIFSSVYL